MVYEGGKDRSLRTNDERDTPEGTEDERAVRPRGAPREKLGCARLKQTPTVT